METDTGGGGVGDEGAVQGVMAEYAKAKLEQVELHLSPCPVGSQSHRPTPPCLSSSRHHLFSPLLSSWCSCWCYHPGFVATLRWRRPRGPRGVYTFVVVLDVSVRRSPTVAWQRGGWMGQSGGAGRRSGSRCDRHCHIRWRQRRCGQVWHKA